MIDENLLWKLEGLHTAETAAETLGIGRQSAINLLSRLKKEGYVATSGGGKQKRLYKITTRKQRKRDPGMFDIINKHSPMKVNEWYDHQVHGPYGPEEALVDAVQTKSFRLILASLRLFNYITNWKKLYNLASEGGVWQQIGALYDVARMNIKTKAMPLKYSKGQFKNKKYLIKAYPTKEDIFKKIEKKWNVAVPFRKGDLYKVIS